MRPAIPLLRNLLRIMLGAAVSAGAAIALFVVWRGHQDFADACKQAGEHYYASPSRPIKALAVDWGGLPEIQEYAVDANGRTHSRGGYAASEFDDPQYRLDFLEVYRSNLWGEGKRVRYAEGGGRPIGAEQDISEFTADAVAVRSEFRYTSPDGRVTPMVVHQTDVSELGGRLLASYTYSINSSTSQACGMNRPAGINEKLFLMRALGITHVVRFSGGPDIVSFKQAFESREAAEVAVQGLTDMHGRTYNSANYLGANIP